MSTSITALVMKDLLTNETPTPGGSSLNKVYEQWSQSEGRARQDNLDIAFNRMVGIISLTGEDSGICKGLMNVAEGARKHGLQSDEAFELYALGQAAERAAKALVVLDIFGETGVIELKSEYARQLELLLHDYEERPPF